MSSGFYSKRNADNAAKALREAADGAERPGSHYMDAVMQGAERGNSINDATPQDWDRARNAAFSKQVGGNHYKDLAIQPVEYIVANNIAYLPGNAIKYVTRWETKGGVEDLRKAIHYIEMMIAEELK